MYRILPVLMACWLGVPAFAQRGGHGGGGGGGMRGGGMVGGGMRGGGATGGMRGGGVTGGVRGGGFRGGFVNGGFRSGFNHRPVFSRGFGFRGSRFGIVPFYSFYGGYGYYDPSFYNSYPSPAPYSYPYAGYGASANPSVLIISNAPDAYAPAPPPPPPPAPESALREYTTPPPADQKYDTPLYLIAFKGGAIRAALAYWVDGATLHYVTLDHEQKQEPLASIDRDLSERLNHERSVTFRLPR